MTYCGANLHALNMLVPVWQHAGTEMACLHQRGIVVLAIVYRQKPLRKDNTSLVLV